MRATSTPQNILPLAAAALLSLIIVWGDYRFAVVARNGAKTIAEKHRGQTGTLWFEGHWGFQYYLEQYGGQAIEVQQSRLAPGDMVAVPTTNSNMFALPPEWAAARETVDIPRHAWMTTMDPRAGAGFYADVFGPLPFALDPVGLERFAIYDVRAAAAQ